MGKISEEKSYRIQVLRGLAIIAVVFIHNTPEGMAQVWCRPFINFSVGLFLFLSGMLSSAKRWNPKKRILKVMIPYAIWSAVYVVLYNYHKPEQIPMFYLKNLITAGAAAVMYYVFVYCELTLLIPLIDKLARSKYKWLGFLISPLEIIIMRLIPLVTHYKMNQYVSVIIGISCLGWFIYYYLGYLLGNDLLEIKIPTSTLLIMLALSIPLQMIEGYWYYSMGISNCGTQMKLTSVLTGVLFALLAYRYLNTVNAPTSKALHALGDYSFGIYFSHLAIMFGLNKVDFYKEFVMFPINAVVVIAISFVCVFIGRKVLGKYAKYLAL